MEELSKIFTTPLKIMETATADSQVKPKVDSQVDTKVEASPSALVQSSPLDSEVPKVTLDIEIRNLYDKAREPRRCVTNSGPHNTEVGRILTSMRVGKWIDVFYENEYTEVQYTTVTDADLQSMYEENKDRWTTAEFPPPTRGLKAKLKNLQKAEGHNNKKLTHTTLLLNQAPPESDKFSGENFTYTDFYNLILYVYNVYKHHFAGSMTKFGCAISGLDTDQASIIIRILRNGVKGFALQYLNQQNSDPTDELRSFFVKYGELQRIDKVKYYENIETNCPDIADSEELIQYITTMKSRLDVLKVTSTDLILVILLRKLSDKKFAMDKLLSGSTQITIEEIIHLIRMQAKHQQYATDADVFYCDDKPTSYKIDSGSDTHVSNSVNDLSSVEECSTKLNGIANVPIHVTQQGTHELDAFTLTKVKVAPKARTSIFSCLQAINDGLCTSIVLEQNHPRIRLPDNKQVKLTFSKRSGWSLSSDATPYIYRRRPQSDKPTPNK